MPLSGLDVGGIFADVGFRYDDRGEQQFRRAERDLHQRTRNDLVQHVKVDADTRGLDRYERAARGVNRANDDMVHGTTRVRSGFGSLFVGGAGLAAGAAALGGLALGAREVTSQFEDARKTAAQTGAVLKSTGGVANVSSRDIDRLSTSLMRKSGIDDDVIRSGQNMLLTFTNVRNEAGRGNAIFDRASRTLLDMSVALGTDSSKSAIQLGKALNDPIKGITALSRVGVTFTAQQKEQIKTLVDSGRTVDAQKIILRELNKEFGGSARAQRTAVGSVTTSLGNLAELAGQKIAPVMDRVARLVRRVSDALQGTGPWADEFQAAGRAIAGTWERVTATIRNVAHWFKDGGAAADVTTSSLAGLAAVLLVVRARMLALAVIARVQAGFAALRGSVIAVNLAMRANPIAAVITVLVALGAALVVAYKRSDSFRAAVDGAFTAARRIVAGFASRFLAMVDGFLWGLQKMAEVAGHLPGVGGKFDDLADKIRGARDRLKGYRTELDNVDKAHRDTGRGTVTLADRIGKARDAYVSARRRLGEYKKGTDEYRDAARVARRRQDELQDAVREMAQRANRGKGPVKDLKVNVDDLGNVTADTAASIGGNVNEVLSELGAKKINFRIVRRRFNRAANSSPGGDAAQRATGGIANPRWAGAADDHMLLDPSGRPVAWMSGTEGILNTPQMAEVDDALALKAGMGLGRYGSLGELWGSGMRHYADGGLLEGIHNPGLSIKNGRAVPPSYWGASTWADHADHIHIAARNVMALARSLAARFGLVITSTTGGQHAAGSYHYRGLAADLGGTSAAMMAAARFLAGGAGGMGGDFGIRTPGIDGPPGAFRTLLRAGAGVMTRAGNRYIDRQSASMGGGDTIGGGFSGPWNTVLGQIAQQRGWNAADWRWIVGHESGGNPNAVNPSSGATGLGQMLGSNVARYHGRGTPVQQIVGMGQYIADRYGSPSRAKAFWQSHGWYGLGGRLRRFATGGHLATSVVGSGGAISAPFLGGSIRQYTPRERTQRYATSLRPMTTDHMKTYEAYRQDVEDLNTEYSLAERRYNLSDEELIDQDTGEVNETAVKRRAWELGKLLNIRDRIVQSLREARKFAAKVTGNYRRILSRIRRSLGHAKGKDRQALRGMQRTYTARLGEWSANIRELRRDTIPNAVLDFRELANELAGIRGTQAEPRDPAGTDTGAGDTATDTGADPAAAAPTAEQVAAAAIQQVQASTAARADLFANFGSNFRTAGMGAVSDAGGGSRNYGATGGADAPAAGGGGDQKTIVQNIVIQEPPPDPHIWAKTVGYELATV